MQEQYSLESAEQDITEIKEEISEISGRVHRVEEKVEEIDDVLGDIRTDMRWLKYSILFGFVILVVVTIGAAVMGAVFGN